MDETINHIILTAQNIQNNIELRIGVKRVEYFLRDGKLYRSVNVGAKQEAIVVAGPELTGYNPDNYKKIGE